ncbi:hypothetical protein GOBAR_DD10567 [Gossypium barbadense]|nr:hypothetical protein GOBAR_DD10567 [Gossypium barbadense]
MKINVDAAWNANMRSAFCGAIVHDHEGIVIAGFTCSIVEAFDAPSAEALTLFCATKKALNKEFFKSPAKVQFQSCHPLFGTLANG